MEQRLIFLDSKQVWIDPQTISLIMSVVNAQPHLVGTKRYGAHVLIETRAGSVHKIPCVDMQGANKLRDTLAHIANARGHKPKKESSVNFDGTPMPGDANYEEWQQRQQRRAV